jgi:glucosamine--fructose-6-phosphate aminotransferase (isomerizing)
VITTSRDEDPRSLGLIDYEFRVPETIDLLMPMLASCRCSSSRTTSRSSAVRTSTMPRNLAKSVTVE